MKLDKFIILLALTVPPVRGTLLEPYSGTYPHRGQKFYSYTLVHDPKPPNDGTTSLLQEVRWWQLLQMFGDADSKYKDSGCNWWQTLGLTEYFTSVARDKCNVGKCDLSLKTYQQIDKIPCNVQHHYLVVAPVFLDPDEAFNPIKCECWDADASLSAGSNYGQACGLHSPETETENWCYLSHPTSLCHGNNGDSGEYSDRRYSYDVCRDQPTMTKRYLQNFYVGGLNGRTSTDSHIWKNKEWMTTYSMVDWFAPNNEPKEHQIRAKQIKSFRKSDCLVGHSYQDIQNLFGVHSHSCYDFGSSSTGKCRDWQQWRNTLDDELEPHFPAINPMTVISTKQIRFTIPHYMDVRLYKGKCTDQSRQKINNDDHIIVSHDGNHFVKVFNVDIMSNPQATDMLTFSWEFYLVTPSYRCPTSDTPNPCPEGQAAHHSTQFQGTRTNDLAFECTLAPYKYQYKLKESAGDTDACTAIITTHWEQCDPHHYGVDYTCELCPDERPYRPNDQTGKDCRKCEIQTQGGNDYLTYFDRDKNKCVGIPELTRTRDIWKWYAFDYETQNFDAMTPSDAPDATSTPDSYNVKYIAYGDNTRLKNVSPNHYRDDDDGGVEKTCDSPEIKKQHKFLKGCGPPKITTFNPEANMKQLRYFISDTPKHQRKNSFWNDMSDSEKYGIYRVSQKGVIGDCNTCNQYIESGQTVPLDSSKVDAGYNGHYNHNCNPNSNQEDEAQTCTQCTRRTNNCRDSQYLFHEIRGLGCFSPHARTNTACKDCKYLKKTENLGERHYHLVVGCGIQKLQRWNNNEVNTLQKECDYDPQDPNCQSEGKPLVRGNDYKGKTHISIQDIPYCPPGYSINPDDPPIDMSLEYDARHCLFCSICPSYEMFLPDYTSCTGSADIDTQITQCISKCSVGYYKQDIPSDSGAQLTDESPSEECIPCKSTCS